MPSSLHRSDPAQYRLTGRATKEFHLKMPGAYPNLEGRDEEISCSAEPIASSHLVDFLKPQRLFMLPRGAKRAVLQGFRPPVMRSPASISQPTPDEAQDTRRAHLHLVACLLVFRIHPQGRPPRRSARSRLLENAMRRGKSPGSPLRATVLSASVTSN